MYYFNLFFFLLRLWHVEVPRPGTEPCHSNDTRSFNCQATRELLILFFKFLFIFMLSLGPHLWHIIVPGLGVELELQLLAYTTATATSDLSRVCELHHSNARSLIY